MRILVVGAGAVGGFFGGYLAAAGRDVTFLVRERRAAALRNGLTLHAIDGDVRVSEPQVVVAADITEPFDLVLLCVKSFALEGTLDDIAPAVGPQTTIVPLLNGMRHFDLLSERFGSEAVVGGLCFVAATLVDGSVKQLGPLQTIVVGELAGGDSARITRVHEALSGAPFDARLSGDIRQALWEKWFVLAAGGALTTLLGGDVGTIESVPNGAATARAIVAECASVAAAAGHAPREKAYQQAERTLTQPGSDFTTSLFRDREAGLEVEADQILGDLVARAQGFGLRVPLLAAADAGLEIYRARRGQASTSPAPTGA
ncbi:2-dehydropantoate 2-reductase [Frondihabitans sucicola]|uniref:2-dehydropantoate 2-reductase n=1 Tax=Frondihabitans sucicola TaxID=1268041 RepID=A0ABN6XWM7_9MICO|nr:2-dehydropantoate 2-reductase [Frondihabitans sucicola]BDZ48332.1 2-dehydropantoate 2-reductase [Frondihabitans sucicola]